MATEAPPLAAASSAEGLFAQLSAKVRAARPGEDLAPLERAYHFALAKHHGQVRKSGDPYIVHPLEIALFLADINMDITGLQTALLHDVVEDCGVKVEELRKEFGDEVAHCVDGVTKLNKVKFYSKEERQAESVRKMLLAMVSDIRVILVKLADRLHNMRTIGALSTESQHRIAQETLDIYAPIAHRLGMGKIRAELEDLSFRALEPEVDADIAAQIAARIEDTESAMQQMKQTLALKLARENIPARLEGRVKRVYSTVQKLRRQKIGIDQVYDLLALRIITDSVKNCYAALGVIHNEWHPIPGRIKDFIAIPRPNLYQSLHTSVIGPVGANFEIQIRTEEMHRIAEEGIAAHWKYKEGKKGPGADDQRVAWLRQLVEWQQEMRDPGEFISTLKGDLYPEEVYCFTPRGRVIILPMGATPVDFAYAIHTDVGHQCTGAKVNGRMVPLRSTLNNGDVVEITTQTGHQPSKDWLALVKTTRARNKIRQVINASERERAIDIGQKALEKEARRMGITLSRLPEAEFNQVISDYGFAKREDLEASLGYGRVSAKQVLTRFGPSQPAPVELPAARTVPLPDTGDLVLRVSGIDDMLIYRAKCCNPIRGEAVVGYITRGKGVAVHSINCTNVTSLLYEVDRKIDVEWARPDKSVADSFQVKMQVYTEDKPGVLNQITSVLTSENSNIRSLEARADEKRGPDSAIIEMTIEVRDKKQLDRVVAGIRRIAGVRDVERSS